jgi:hypothetical protein
LAGGFRCFVSAIFSSIARFWAMRAAVRSAGVIKWNGLFINYHHRALRPDEKGPDPLKTVAGRECQRPALLAFLGGEEQVADSRNFFAL